MKCEICGKEISRCDNCGTELMAKGYICIIGSVKHFHSAKCAEEWAGKSEPTLH